MTTPRLTVLLQSNLVNEEDQQPYVTALEATKARYPDRMDWSYVKLVPFAGTVEPERDYGPLVFPIGSTSMLAASQRYGWRPGVVYDAATFRFEAWRDHWGAANLINGDAVVTTFGAAKVFDDIEAFIRPCEDLKAFTGCVVSIDGLLAWQQRVYDGCQSTQDSPLLTMATPVVVAPVKTITREWRTWIVNGVVKASSQYAEYGQRVRKQETPSSVRVFAERLAQYWSPGLCFCLDVGELEDGSLGLVEINTLNSSGVYAADMAPVYGAIVEAFTS